MPDMEKVIAWLADTELYYQQEGKTKNDMYQSIMAHNALALLKEQQHQIWEMQEVNEHLNDLLKEQEPVRPVFDDSRQDVIGTHHCGACHSMLGFIHPLYCPHCGRKVKWE